MGKIKRGDVLEVTESYFKPQSILAILLDMHATNLLQINNQLLQLLGRICSLFYSTGSTPTLLFFFCALHLRIKENEQTGSATNSAQNETLDEF